MMHPSLRAALIALTLGVAVGCSHDTTTSTSDVAEIDFTESNYAVGVGVARQLQAFVYNSRHELIQTGLAVTWTSSDPTHVTVDAAGNATGVALGGAVVTASAGGHAATTAVTAIPASIVISPTLDSVLVGQTVQLTASARDASGNALNGGATTWSVSSPGVATISPGGVLTGTAMGRVNVSAVVAGGTGTVATGVPGAFDGTWQASGTDANGNPRPVFFKVRFGYVTTGTVPNIPTTCGGGLVVQFTAPLDAPIVNGQFATTSTQLLPAPAGYPAPMTSSSWTVSGTFTSANALTGTYTAAAAAVILCPAGGFALPFTPTSAYTAFKQ